MKLPPKTFTIERRKLEPRTRKPRPATKPKRPIIRPRRPIEGAPQMRSGSWDYNSPDGDE
jgi:hypothetical protein